MHVHAFLGDWEGLVAETQADSQSERGALGCGPFGPKMPTAVALRPASLCSVANPDCEPSRGLGRRPLGGDPGDMVGTSK